MKKTEKNFLDRVATLAKPLNIQIINLKQFLNNFNETKMNK